MTAIDFSKATTLEPVADGTYEAVCTKCEFVAETKNSKQPGVKFEFTLSDPEVEGKKAFTTKSLQPSGMWSTKETFIALGTDPDLLNGVIEDIESLCEEVTGVACRLVLSSRRNTNNPSDTRLYQNVDKVLSQYDLS